MPSAQDIYDVLIKDPQYEGSHGLSREEIVEREAKRRARQHANNEKALSMAVQNSAIDKLFTFVNSRFLRKELGDFEKKIKANIGIGKPITEHLAKLEEALKYFTTLTAAQEPKMSEDERAGWEMHEHIGDIKPDQMVEYTNPTTQVKQRISIYEAGRRLAKEKKLMQDVVTGLIASNPQTIEEMFEEEADGESKIRDAKALFKDDGQIDEAHAESATNWLENAAADEFKNSIQQERTGEGSSAPPTPAATQQEIIDDPKLELGRLNRNSGVYKTFELLRASTDADGNLNYANPDGSGMTHDQLTEPQVRHMLNHAKAVSDLTGDTQYPAGSDERKNDLARRRKLLTEEFQPEAPVQPQRAGTRSRAATPAAAEEAVPAVASVEEAPSAVDEEMSDAQWDTLIGSQTGDVQADYKDEETRWFEDNPGQEMPNSKALDILSGIQGAVFGAGRAETPSDGPEVVEETPSAPLGDLANEPLAERQRAYNRLPDEVKAEYEFKPEQHTLEDIANFHTEFYVNHPDEVLANREANVTAQDATADRNIANSPAIQAVVADIRAENAGQETPADSTPADPDPTLGDDMDASDAFDYDSDTGYKHDRPRKINGPIPTNPDGSIDEEAAEEQILNPREIKDDGTLGEEYNPFAAGNDTDIDAEFKKIKDIYLGLHNAGPLAAGNRPPIQHHLGTGPSQIFFPIKEDEDNRKYFDKFDTVLDNDGKEISRTDKWNDDQIKIYNELNTNKAIVEQYLRLFGNIKKQTHNQPWTYQIPQSRHEPQVEADDTISWLNNIWLHEPTSDNIPGHGTAMWHELLESSGPEASKDGFLNFYMLDSRFFQAGSYKPDPKWQENFLGNRFGVDDSDKVAKDAILSGTAWRDAVGIPHEFVEGEDADQRFTRAWTAWQQERQARHAAGVGRPRDEDTFIPDFYSYLVDENEAGQKRADAFILDSTNNNTEAHDNFVPVPRGGPDDPYAVTETPEPETSAEEVIPAAGDSATVTSNEDEIASPSRRGTQAVSTLTPDKRQEYIDKLMEYEENTGLTEDNRQMFLDHFTDLEDKDLKAQFITHVIERDRKDRAGKSKADIAAGKKPPEMKEDERARLIREYAEAHQEIYNSPVDSRKMQILEGKSEKELKAIHEKMIDETHGKMQARVKSGQRFDANNKIPSSLATPEMQAHLTKDDIRMQVRRLIHHHTAYGEHMDGDAQKLWKERMQEAHKLAAAAGMNLEGEMHKDREEAERHGDWGSSEWLKRIGEAHHDTLTRRQGHREAVSKGSELRRNVNYKPHLVATYDDNGNFQTFMNTRDNQPVDQHELRFDDDNHYQFHGLDSDRVKEFRRYLQLKEVSGRELGPGEIPSAFDSPSDTDAEYEALKTKIKDEDGQTLPEYDAIEKRLEQVGELPGAKEVFYNKFGKTASGRPSRPVNPDGTEMDVPRFHRDAEDTVGTPGWYHPESESWINPHRYNYLMDSMGNQPGSGRHITQGNQYFGRDAAGKPNPADPKYAFALLTNAKKGKIRQGLAGDQTYYLDNSGAIAHAHDAFEAGHMQEHIQPQTVNDVVHDWYAQQMESQIQANPQAFANEQGKLRDVTVVDSPPGTQQPPEAPKATVPSPFQNMWLELEALGRDPNSALGRREKKKESGWEQYDRGEHQPKFMGRDISRLRHPFSKPARDPLSAQELGQDKWWQGSGGKGVEGLKGEWLETKQRAFDVLDQTPGIVSWAAKKLLGGETTEDKVIRRIRRGYQVQAETERITREAASRVTLADGTKLSDLYVAPGEQKARNEDYAELKRYLAHRSATHRVQNQQATQANDKETAKSHDVQDKQYQVLSQTLGQLDSKLPGHWDKINDMYNAHLGNVQQAPTAEASLNQWGNEMQQPSSLGADILQQPSQQTSKIPVPSAFDEVNQGFVKPTEESQSGKIPVPSAFPSN